MGNFARQMRALLKVAVSQGMVLAALYALRPYLSSVLTGGDPMLAVLLLLMQGAVAAGIGHVLGLSSFWIPLQLILPLSVALSPFVPVWVYPLCLMIIALAFWNSPGERVPLYLSNATTCDALSRIVRMEGAASFVDLGCGTGSVVARVARSNPNLSVLGVETAPLVFAFAFLRLALTRPGNGKVVFRNLWREDLSKHDIVYAFLSPAPMPRLYEQARTAMRKDSLFISNSFEVPGIAPDRIEELDDPRRTRLYIYRME